MATSSETFKDPINRSYPGTPPFWCRESCPYHEEPMLKTSFYPILSALAALFLHCSTMVTLTSLQALSLQHNEVELEEREEEK